MIFGINTTRDISKLSQITYNNFEISLVVFIPNITTNHAITYTNTSINLYEQILFLLPVGHNVDCNTVRIFAYASPGFKYARAVKQKVSNEAELLTSRKKPTVLQSSL